MSTEHEQVAMKGLLARAGEKAGLLWLLSPMLKHDLIGAEGYRCNVESGKPDTFLGVEIMVVLKQRHFQLVRVVA